MQEVNKPLRVSFRLPQEPTPVRAGAIKLENVVDNGDGTFTATLPGDSRMAMLLKRNLDRFSVRCVDERFELCDRRVADPLVWEELWQE